MDRASKERFSKKRRRIHINIIWAILFIILLPWISIIAKFEILNKILDLFDELMNRTINENGNAKKVDYLVKNYKIIIFE